MAIAGAANHESLASFGLLWQSDAYGHGPIVVLFILYVVWRLGRDLAARPSQASLSGLVLLAAAAVAWTLASIIEVQLGEQLGAVGFVWGATWAIFGAEKFRLLAFPLSALALVTSAWDLLLGPLQVIAAEAAKALLPLTGIPIYSDGLYISIPNGQFEIAEACAGLRYLLAGITFAYMFAALHIDRLPHRIAFVALTGVLMVPLNVLRVLAVVVMGHFLGMQHPLVEDHGSTGWLIFAVGLVPLILLGNFVANRAQATTVSDGSKAARTEPSHARRRLVVVAVVAVVAGAGATLPMLGAEWATARTDPLSADRLVIGPVDGWQPVAEPASGWEPAFQGPALERHAAFRGDGALVELYVAAYDREAPGAKLIYFGNRLAGQDEGRVLDSSNRRVEAAGDAWSARELRIQPHTGPASRTIRYWYYVAGRRTGSDVEAKLLRLRQALAGTGGAAVVAIAATGPDAATRLDRFLAAQAGPLECALKAAGVAVPAERRCREAGP